MAAVAAGLRPPRPGPASTRSRGRTRALAGWIGIALVLLAWAFTLRPTQLGGPATFIVVSGDSMEPTLSSGDLVILRERPEYEVSDVVAFPVPAGEPGEGVLIIHRIVGGTSERFDIQGDNRDEIDEWYPAAEDVEGSLWWHIPSGGRVVMTMFSPPVAAGLAGGVFTMWLLLRDPKGGTKMAVTERKAGSSD